MITNVYSFANGASGHATIGELVRAALYLGPRTLEELQALMPAEHRGHVRTVLLSLVAEGVAEVYQREESDPESLPKPDDAGREHPDTSAFRHRLRATREAAGLSQYELATACGLQQAHIAHFEAGRRCPSLKNLLAIARALRVTVDSLVYYEVLAPGSAGARSPTYRELPPDLQAVWIATYTATLVRPNAATAPNTIGPLFRARAATEAMDAVRIASGGELPAVPSRDIVAEGVEIARAKLERDLIDAMLEEAPRLTTWSCRIAVAFNSLRSFEAQHGRRP